MLLLGAKSYSLPKRRALRRLISQKADEMRAQKNLNYKNQPQFQLVLIVGRQLNNISDMSVLQLILLSTMQFNRFRLELNVSKKVTMPRILKNVFRPHYLNSTLKIK
jgi:hypothetical protein